MKSDSCFRPSAILALILSVLMTEVSSDIYLHNPRGSNNRLDEQAATRQNANRLFDSQNNNRGGYNVGDVGSTPAKGKEELQYQMRYFQSGPSAPSELELEWTMQHGCGERSEGPSEVNCQVVIQYMCQDPSQLKDPKQRMRDGISTKIQDFAAVADGKIETESEAKARETAALSLDRGLHESWKWYDDCAQRRRNRGLFTADFDVCQNDKCCQPATVTRQNPKGGRNGFECPEERDYYPYWHPTPWKDVAILTTNDKDCSRLPSESFNLQPRQLCIEFYPNNGNRKHWSKWNNRRDCESNGGSWLELHNYMEKATQFKTKESCEQNKSNARQYIWGLAFDGNARNPECLVPLPPPKCESAPWTRSNHLGNGIDGRSSHFTWTLPHFPSGQNQSCVLRIRYNISTSDYNQETTDWKSNWDKTANRQSPIRTNPLVNFGGVCPLRLTINTQQTGRTFQDRSHIFWLIPRTPKLKEGRIHNLNVKGKRGNIVQTYPAIEYDFVPKELKIKLGEFLHIQWTGSNTHNNSGNNGNNGDGAAGADGQGTEGSDRHNLLPLNNLADSYPELFWKSPFWKSGAIVWSHHGRTNMTPLDLALELASAGYYRCANETTCPDVDKDFIFSAKKEKLSSLLNNAPASYPGVVLAMKRGVYHFMCTRNNNFSNRSQKGTLIVY